MRRQRENRTQRRAEVVNEWVSEWVSQLSSAYLARDAGLITVMSLISILLHCQRDNAGRRLQSPRAQLERHERPIQLKHINFAQCAWNVKSCPHSAYSSTRGQYLSSLARDPNAVSVKYAWGPNDLCSVLQTVNIYQTDHSFAVTNIFKVGHLPPPPGEGGPRGLPALLDLQGAVIATHTARFSIQETWVHAIQILCFAYTCRWISSGCGSVAEWFFTLSQPTRPWATSGFHWIWQTTL